MSKCQKNHKRLLFLICVFIFLFGVFAFLLFYILYGKTVSPFECLFNAPQNIANFVREPYAVLSNGYSILLIRFFWYVWWIGFVTSLFFLGRQFQKESKIIAENAIFTKKEPYLLLKDICNTLKQIKCENEELYNLFIAVKHLEQRLFVESDFGYGNNNVISCENEIAIQLQLLRDSISNIETSDIKEDINVLFLAISSINSLLCKRIELKKRGS